MKSVTSFLSLFSGPLTLRQRMSILVTILVIFQLGLIGMIFSRSIANMLEEQIGKRALRVAQAVLNAGYVFRTFEDESIAVDWLTGVLTS